MNEVLNKGVKWAAKNSPAILTGMGCVGLVSTAASAYRAGKEVERDKVNTISDRKERIKRKAGILVPTVIMGGTSIACIIGAHKVNLKRQIALTTAYTAARGALSDFQEKAVAELGQRKVDKIKQQVVEEKMNENPLTSDKQVIVTEKGNHLIFDTWSGRYFRSDIESVRKSVNDVNATLLSTMFVSLNELYYELGLDQIKGGADIGWNADCGGIQVHFGSSIAANGDPCLTMDFLVAPKYDYKEKY